MAKLVLSFQDMTLDEFPLTKERLTIGRAADNDIRIDNLAVSSHHAELRTIDGRSVIEDLNSTNGTLVNGQPIKEYTLRNGDLIIIGKHRLTYFGVAQPGTVTQTQPQTEEKTVFLGPRPTPQATPDQATPANAASAPAAAEAEMAQLAKLQVLSGTNAGREMQLTKALTKLGKPGVQVAAISRRQQGYYLIHVEGQDGRTPIVNGEVIGNQARKLNEGDTLEIAGTKMGFFLV